jgi:membrane protease YdiL (CAAX protease family)
VELKQFLENHNKYLAMYDIHSKPGANYVSGIFMLIGMACVGLFLGSLASFAIWMLMTGKSVMAMQENMYNPAYANVLKIIQLVSTFFVFFIPSWITAKMLSKKPFQLLRFNLYFSFNQLGIVFLIMLGSSPLVGALTELNKVIPIPSKWAIVFKQMEENYNEQVTLMASVKTWGDYFLSLLLMAFAPALFEEMLFRGGLQNLLQKWSKDPWLAIGVTSIIFSMIHFSWYGFIPRVALSVILGLIFYYSGSIWLSIWGHFINNALAVTQIFYYTSKGKSIEEAMNDTTPWYWGLMALAGIVLLFLVFHHIAKNDRKNKVPPETLSLEEQWLA